MKFIKEFLEQKKWNQLKKSDWIVLALVGVLMLIIAMPSGNKNHFNNSVTAEAKKTETKIKEKNTNTETNNNDDYAKALEHKLEQVLSQMEGVGEVKVMITMSDAGEYVVEKDDNNTQTTTTEVDGGGGNRTVTEGQRGEQTVYVENGNEKYPYVQKEKMPTIEGVMVVAEGGGNARIVSDISDAVLALFPVEPHRIKVVKMKNDN